MMDESMLKKEVLQELMDFMDERVADKLAKKKMGAMSGTGEELEAEPVASKMEIEVEAAPEGGGAVEKMKEALMADAEGEEMEEEEDDDEYGLPSRFKKMRA